MLFNFSHTTTENVYAVIVSLAEEERSDDALDYLMNLCSDENDYRIGASPVFSEISQLSAAFEKAMVKCGVIREPENRITRFWYNEILADKIIFAVSSKMYDVAERIFKDFVEAATEHNKSFLYEKMAYFRLLNQLCAYADEEGIPIESATIDKIVASADRQEMRLCFYEMLQALCNDGGILCIDAKEKNSRSAELVEYIYQNYADKNLCLDVLAGHFRLSNRYVSKLIKDAVHLSYKDFLTGIRIKKAQEYLLEGVSVSETCSAVGYANLSHFIKAFKAVTGYTPAGFAGKHHKRQT